MRKQTQDNAIHTNYNTIQVYKLFLEHSNAETVDLYGRRHMQNSFSKLKMAYIKQSQSEESYKQKHSQSTTYKRSKTVKYQPLSIHASSLIVKSKKINTMGMENTQNSGRILLLTVNTGTLSAL